MLNKYLVIALIWLIQEDSNVIFSAGPGGADPAISVQSFTV